MKSILIAILILTFHENVICQNITPERVEIARKSIGRISMDNTNTTGTGFFISAEGDVLTCWHVIQPSIILDSSGNIVNIGRIFIVLVSGDSIELKIPVEFFNPEINRQAVGNDFCMLRPAKALKKKATFLKLGRFENISEGEDIYTVGYPLSMQNQFISKGILSTKFIESSDIYYNNNTYKITKNLALLDLTANKGNSGGPILKFGKTESEDQVVGIANFLINPYGASAEKLVKDINENNLNVNIDLGNGSQIPLTEIFKLFANAISTSSNGISGCVSINHFLQVLK